MSDHPEAPLDGAPAVNTAALERLRSWGGESLLQQLVALFLQETPLRVGAIRSALSGGDLAEGERGAHSLRSTAQNLGADRLSALAREAEHALRRGDTSIGPLVERIESEAQRVYHVFQPSPATPAPVADSTLPRIAVVEDNPDNRLLVQALLGDRYEIDEYEAGREAVEGITANPPELVLLDISLPEMDGTEVLELIRRHEGLEQLPVIALTAHAMAGDREKYLSLGFDDYVTKPIIDEEVLIEAIEKWRSATP